MGQKYVLNAPACSADSIGQLIPLEGSDSIYLHFRLFRKRAIERHIPGSNAASHILASVLCKVDRHSSTLKIVEDPLHYSPWLFRTGIPI